MNTVQLLYMRELRAAWRERGVWLGSLIMPVLLGPVALWLLVSAVGLASGQGERDLPRVAVWVASSQAEGVVAAAQGTAPWQSLQARLMEDPQLAVRLVADGQGLASALSAGDLDLVLEILPASGAAAELLGNRQLRLTYDGSSDRSQLARQTVLRHLDGHRDVLLQRQADELDLSPSQWQVFALEARNMASDGDVGAFVLGLLVPLFTVVMVAVGCIFPAIETIAGERERRTWETTLGLAVPRHEIILAKYLYVATCGTLAGLLNLSAITLSMRAILAPLLGMDGAGLSFEIPLRALPLIILSTVLLALFIAAGMMIFASFARTFKEGQAMVGPFLLLCLLPLLVVQSPDLELDPLLAMIPVANVMLLFRQMIGGGVPWGLILLTLLAETVWVVLCLRLSRYLLGFEELWLGDTQGGFFAFIARTWRRSKDLGVQGG